jgi:hypothetical protein
VASNEGCVDCGLPDAVDRTSIMVSGDDDNVCARDINCVAELRVAAFGILVEVFGENGNAGDGFVVIGSSNSTVGCGLNAAVGGTSIMMSGDDDNVVTSDISGAAELMVAAFGTLAEVSEEI